MTPKYKKLEMLMGGGGVEKFTITIGYLFMRSLRKKLAPDWNDVWPYIVEKSSKLPTVMLGSGLMKVSDKAVYVDLSTETNPDVVWDLNNYPYPFEDNTFDVVIAISILEHLKDFFKVMAEIHRISKPGASVYILVPHFSSAAAHIDPTHCQFFSARSCDYFIDGTEIEREYGFYVPYRFKLVKRYVKLAGILNYFFPFRWLAEQKNSFWEAHLCYILRGSGVFWELVVTK